jgi:predicted phosphodiesterase
LRTAIISDIHGNIAGLHAVLADAEACRADRILCLGDLVDGNDAGNEAVVELIRARAIPTLRGNHDEFPSSVLAQGTLLFLTGLPETIVEGEIVYTHVSPRSQKRTVRSTADAWHIFDDTPQRIVFLGHTHIPFLFGQKGGAGIGARFIEFRYNRPHPIDPEDRYVVCVGAVGYPRDGMNKIRYVIHDEAAQTIEFRAIAGELLPFGSNNPGAF